MPKTRKRTQPVTVTSYSSNTDKQLSGPRLIRRFHVLLKLRDRLLASGSKSAVHELAEVQSQINSLGGLEAYQSTSARGQGETRGGGSEKVLVGWLREVGENERKEKGGKKLRLLEVGAVKYDNYSRHAAWIDSTPIDLRSRHPLIQEQDFLKMDEQAHSAKWDVISLSLVVNFVPDPHDRGRMLSVAHRFLCEGGYLFLALPLPCVTNSRYLDFNHLRSLMTVIGFTIIKERWKTGGRMGYWLFQKGTKASVCNADIRENYKTKAVLKEGSSRNNFSILL